MYEPDAHRYDCALGDVPMMRKPRYPSMEFDWADVEPLPLGWEMRCFMPCHEQLTTGECACTRRQRSVKHSGDPLTCPHGIGKPSYCETCALCTNCGRYLYGYRHPDRICRYCAGEAE